MNVRRDGWVLAALGGLLAGLGCSTGTPDAAPPPVTADPSAAGDDKNHCAANDADGKHHCASKDGKHTCSSTHGHDAPATSAAASSAGGTAADAGAPPPPAGDGGIAPATSAAKPDAGKPGGHTHADGKPHKH